jgi:two-component system, OmpR family, sensor histidine kinase ChvG
MTALRVRLARWLEWRPSRIGLGLLTFNLLLVFLPVAGILYLDVYEWQLLDAQERAMVQQGRVVAAALGGHDPLDAFEAEALLLRLGRRGEARIRVYGVDAALVADSVRADPLEGDRTRAEGASEYESAVKGVRDRPLYRFGAWLAKARRAARALMARFAGIPDPATGGASSGGADQKPPESEVRAALAGRYGAGTRTSPGQRSLTLYSAVPIRAGERVTGAVLVSQSTFGILQAIYEVRLRIFEIVVASVLVAIALGVLMSATIVRPLVRLRRAAVAIGDRRALPGGFGYVNRRDEIGDLARTLEALTTRLDAHIRLLESFAADVSHEFRNPLASIRTAAEMIASTEDSAGRDRLLAMLVADVDRLERLVSGVRELARIDSQLAHEAVEPVDVSALLGALVEGFRLRDPRIELSFTSEPGLTVRAARDRLAQVFENIVENASSLAPPGSSIDVTVSVDRDSCVVRIADRGPGIPAGHLERVFERFFSYRPSDRKSREHMGLGLAIAKAIVEGYAGSIAALNRAGGGTVIEIRLPQAGAQPSSRTAQALSGFDSVS